MLFTRLRVAPALQAVKSRRFVSSVASNPHIKVFPNTALNNSHILTFLDTNPPSTDLAIGTTSENPPTPRSFSENPKFLTILYEVLSKHAAQDPALQSQAQAFAGPGGSTFISGGFSQQQQQQQQQQQARRRGSKGNSAGAGGVAASGGGGGASAQGGAGGAGRGGHVHLSDSRNPPDFGRIAWPEDILGSIEVDGHGNIVGEFEPSGTYRILTNEGILGLSDHIRNKLIETLKEREKSN